MRNTYQITRHEIMEPNLFEIRGCAFCIEDLYEFVGRQEFVCTFYFREGSNAYESLGRSISGRVAYTKDQRAALDRCESAIEGRDILRVHCVEPSLSQQARDDLKYGGVSISDLEELSFIPFAQPMKVNEDGTKRVPGILHVDIGDTRSVDTDKLFQNLVAMKNNSGTELIPYETERLIGITLGLNDGHIDSRVLTHFGYDVASASASEEIHYYRLRTKMRRSMLAAPEAELLRDLEAIRWMKRVRLLLNEIERSGISPSELKCSHVQLAAIQESLFNFEPHVLLNGRKQVYWDLECYLHIALRHVRQMQLGSFKSKTAFPYKAAELETLAEQVLRQVDGEIHRHFEGPTPHNTFGRHGNMAVYFNGDYFCLKIDEAGRLVTFYVTQPRSL